nr:DNA-directed RNA polymerases II, IV and V subunit 9A [Ipomoea batatas]
MSTTKKFCPKCNNENELYPKEDEEWKIRVYACRTCDHREVAQQYLVSAEPKLHRTRCVICPKCEHWGVEFFMADASSSEDQEAPHLSEDASSSEESSEDAEQDQEDLPEQHQEENVEQDQELPEQEENVEQDHQRMSSIRLPEQHQEEHQEENVEQDHELPEQEENVEQDQELPEQEENVEQEKMLSRIRN